MEAAAPGGEVGREGRWRFHPSECGASGTRLPRDRSQRNTASRPPLRFLPLDTGSGPPVRAPVAPSETGEREPKPRGDSAERLLEAAQTQAALPLTALPDPADPQGSHQTLQDPSRPGTQTWFGRHPSHFGVEEPGQGLAGLIRPLSKPLERAGLGRTPQLPVSSPHAPPGSAGYSWADGFGWRGSGGRESERGRSTAETVERFPWKREKLASPGLWLRVGWGVCGNTNMRTRCGNSKPLGFRTLFPLGEVEHTGDRGGGGPAAQGLPFGLLGEGEEGRPSALGRPGDACPRTRQLIMAHPYPPDLPVKCQAPRVYSPTRSTSISVTRSLGSPGGSDPSCHLSPGLGPSDPRGSGTGRRY